MGRSDLQRGPIPALSVTLVSYIYKNYLRITFLTQRLVELPLLDAENLGADATDRLDQETVRTVPNHRDERARSDGPLAGTLLEGRDRLNWRRRARGDDGLS
jgi:hypothetical protein